MVHRIRLDGVETLLRDGDDGGPAELLREEGLGVLVDATPDGLEHDLGGRDVREDMLEGAII